jgi:hypothetical protein
MIIQPKQTYAGSSQVVTVTATYLAGINPTSGQKIWAEQQFQITLGIESDVWGPDIGRIQDAYDGITGGTTRINIVLTDPSNVHLLRVYIKLSDGLFHQAFWNSPATWQVTVLGIFPMWDRDSFEIYAGDDLNYWTRQDIYGNEYPCAPPV